MRHFLMIIPVVLIGFNSYSQDKPTTRKCQKKTIERVRKQCICKDIEQYAKENYDLLSVSSYAQSGLNRIYSRFNISNSGEIQNLQVKGYSPELEKEAIRTLMSFPHLIPASDISDSKIVVDDFYTVIIQFEIKNTITNL